MSKFANPEKLEAAPPPKGAVQSGMDTTFMLPYYRESVRVFVQGKLPGLSPVEFDHDQAQELVEEQARLRKGPPHRSMGGAYDEIKFKTDEYYYELQEASARGRKRKKAGKKKRISKEKRRRMARRRREEANTYYPPFPGTTERGVKWDRIGQILEEAKRQGIWSPEE